MDCSFTNAGTIPKVHSPKWKSPPNPAGNERGQRPRLPGQRYCSVRGNTGRRQLTAGAAFTIAYSIAKLCLGGTSSPYIRRFLSPFNSSSLRYFWPFRLLCLSAMVWTLLHFCFKLSFGLSAGPLKVGLSCLWYRANRHPTWTVR